MKEKGSWIHVFFLSASAASSPTKITPWGSFLWFGISTWWELLHLLWRVWCVFIYCTFPDYLAKFVTVIQSALIVDLLNGVQWGRNHFSNQRVLRNNMGVLGNLGELLPYFWGKSLKIRCMKVDSISIHQIAGEVGIFDLTNSVMVECLDSLNRITCQAAGNLQMGGADGFKWNKNPDEHG